jgi:hypothetical protein
MCSNGSLTTEVACRRDHPCDAHRRMDVSVRNLWDRGAPQPVHWRRMFQFRGLLVLFERDIAMRPASPHPLEPFCTAGRGPRLRPAPICE